MGEAGPIAGGRSGGVAGDRAGSYDREPGAKAPAHRRGEVAHPAPYCPQRGAGAPRPERGSALSRPAPPASLIALLAILSLLALAGLSWGARKAMTDSADLLRRAEEVELFLRGVDPYSDPDMTYPPSAPPVFVPLVAPFHGPALKGVWLGLNLAALLALGVGLPRLTGDRWPTWLVVAFGLALAASKPVRGGIGLGQFHLIPTALVAWALLAARARREALAGLMLGLALAKPTMALPFLGLLATRGRWRAVAVALGLQAALLAGTSAWLGVGPGTLVREWIRLAGIQMGAGAIDLPTLFHRAWPEAGGAGSAISLAILAATFAATVAMRRQSDLALAGVCGAAAAVFSYHRFYDLVLLAFPMAHLVDAARRQQGPWWLVAGGFAALLIVPEQPFEWVGLGRPYEWAFLVLVYILLGLDLALVARSRPGGAD